MSNHQANHYESCHQSDQRILFITSNVGSAFPLDSKISENLRNLLVKYIRKHSTSYVFLNFQEFGGKKHLCVDDGIKFFSSIYKPLSDLYPDMTAFYDDDSHDELAYTALSNVILANTQVSPLEIFNNKDKKFEKLPTGLNLAPFSKSDQWTHKEKFPVQYFPDKKLSRKGFSSMRMKTQDKIFDNVNLHLIHEVDYRRSILQTPSPYAECRSDQLEYIVNFLKQNGSIESFIYGDFNYRSCVRTLVRDLHPSCEIDDDKSSDSVIVSSKNCLEEKSPTSKEVAKATSKGFEIDFSQNHPNWRDFLLKSNIEYPKKDLDCHELKITFHPTYCFSEEEGSLDYKVNRTPSWCDRIMIRGPCYEKISKGTNCGIYEAIGYDDCIGDHKPVCLLVSVKCLSSSQ